MGIDVSALRALNAAFRLYAADFSRTITLGRQTHYFKKRELSRIIRQTLSSSASDEECPLKLLGAESVHAIDASSYQDADIIADFNEPLPPTLHDAYSLYCDFGSMEHIFDAPQVLRNALDLVRPGGHLVIVTPCCGFEGHGLYQFSPEFFYSTFAERNGLSRTSVFVVDLSRGGRWYYVRDPAAAGRRTNFRYRAQGYVVAITQKSHRVSKLRVQQSDYEFGSWKRAGKPRPQRRRRAGSKWPRTVRNAIGAVVRPVLSLMLGLRSGDLVPIDIERISPDAFWRMARESAEKRSAAGGQNAALPSG